MFISNVLLWRAWLLIKNGRVKWKQWRGSIDHIWYQQAFDTRGIQLCLCLRHKRCTVVSNVSDTRGIQLCLCLRHKRYTVVSMSQTQEVYSCVLCLRHKRCTVVSNVSDTRGIQLCLMSQRHVLETLKQWKQNQLLSQARWCSSKTPSSATTELCTCSHDVDQ